MAQHLCIGFKDDKPSWALSKLCWSKWQVLSGKYVKGNDQLGEKLLLAEYMQSRH